MSNYEPMNTMHFEYGDLVEIIAYPNAASSVIAVYVGRKERNAFLFHDGFCTELTSKTFHARIIVHFKSTYHEL